MEKTGEVAPALIAAWLAARSVSRGLPPPVRDHGGLRVDTDLPDELCRYVYAAPVPAIRTLAASVTAARTLIKLCGPCAQLRALVDDDWSVRHSGYMMVHDGGAAAPAALPDGYRLDLFTQGAKTTVNIIGPDGTPAASGHAVDYATSAQTVFIVDRIRTEEAHRRRGLGKALMAALMSAQRAPAAQRVLVATEEGRALYATLGWTVLSLYSTATRL